MSGCLADARKVVGKSGVLNLCLNEGIAEARSMFRTDLKIHFVLLKI